MTSRLLFVAVLFLSPIICFSSLSHAQWTPGPSGGRFGSATEPQPTTITGKVAAEDGSDLGPDTIVILQCGNQQRARSSVDKKGTFALLVNGVRPPDLITGVSADQGSPLSQEPTTSWSNCDLYSESSGYKSDLLHLAGGHLDGILQVGTLVLHRLGQTGKNQTFTVNAAALAAPDSAKKAFAQGQQQAKKGKWAAACDYFKRAVQVYPRFALAWLELGRAQLQQNNFVDAQQSFQQATTQDSNLVPAYVELARVAAEHKEWKVLADATARIVELAPQAPAMFWLWNSAANYNVGDVSRAESSATRGLRLDQKHEFPRLEYLYGMILARQQKYQEATEHLKNYLHLAPKAPDAGEAQQKLQECEKLLATSIAH